jgi:hypothetical protein
VNVINLTPDPINIANINGDIIMTLPPSDNIAEVYYCSDLIEYMGEIPISRECFLDLINLPEPEDDVIYVVSREVARAAKRPDVLTPDTRFGAIRKDGQVVAIRGFLTFA